MKRLVFINLHLFNLKRAMIYFVKCEKNIMKVFFSEDPLIFSLLPFAIYLIYVLILLGSTYFGGQNYLV